MAATEQGISSVAEGRFLVSWDDSFPADTDVDGRSASSSGRSDGMSSRSDIYFGPFVSFLEFSAPNQDLKADDDFAPGIVLGLDVPLGLQGWGISDALRYIDTEIDFSNPRFGLTGTVDFSLLSMGLGVSKKF